MKQTIMEDKMKDDWSLREFANPCMKCGSVECAVCGKDIETLHKKLIEEIGNYENPFISEEYFNPTNAYEKLEHLRSFVIDKINKRFGVE